MALVDVLIPTYERKTGLAVVLTSLLGQTVQDFNVIISSQSPDINEDLFSVEIATLVRALEWHGHHVELHHHLPRRGMAEQRQFLLERSTAPYVHYLDDDVLLDSPVMERMLCVLCQERCGFVGCSATGLDYLHDVRSHQQRIEVWEGPVTPEPFEPESIPWERHMVNNAANPLHLERRLAPHGETVRYKVAWVGGANVLYDRAKLLAVGGFSFWERLPPTHAGEEVVTQFLLIRYFGGCGILPSGTYHLGLPTTIEDRRSNATALFAELLREHEAVRDRRELSEETRQDDFERRLRPQPAPRAGFPPECVAGGDRERRRTASRSGKAKDGRAREELRMSSMELRGKVALVTGAGSGLGEATAHAFAVDGCAVACVDVNGTAAERVSGELAALDVPSVGLQCDVSDAAAVSRTVETVVERLGRLDYAVNCAAIDHTVSVEDMTIEQWDQVIAVNLRGPFLVAKAALPIMKRQRAGHIVNIASTAATRAWANAAAYHASKWGLVGFSRGLGVEGRQDGIRVTTIIPGGMKTHFFDRFVDQGIPMPEEQNLQDPANVARVILFAVQMPADSALQEVIVTPVTETSWP